MREALRQLVHERVVERAGAQLADLGEILERADGLVREIEQDVAERGAQADATDATDKLVAVHRLLRRFHHQMEAVVGNPVLDGLLQQARAFSDDPHSSSSPGPPRFSHSPVTRASPTVCTCPVVTATPASPGL